MQGTQQVTETRGRKAPTGQAAWLWEAAGTASQLKTDVRPATHIAPECELGIETPQTGVAMAATNDAQHKRGDSALYSGQQEPCRPPGISTGELRNNAHHTPHPADCGLQGAL